MATLFCQNPEISTQSQKTTKWKIFKKNSQDVRLDMIIAILTTPTKTSKFLKRPSKINSKSEKKLSLKISWQNFFLSIQFFGRIESSFRNVAHQFFPNYWKTYVLKIRKGLWVSQEIFCPSFFFWTCNLIFWQHWRIFTANNFKCFWSIPVVFEKSTIFEIKSAKSTSDRQTHSSYKPTELPGQKSKKVTQNPREKLPQQSFQQKIFFLKLFLGRHRR